MRRKALMLMAVFVLLAITVVPAFAVTDGELDGDGHPAVVLLLMEIGGVPRFRCSGTLLSPTVLLTAGHCTNGFPDFEFSGMRIFTESDVDGGNNNYPFAGPNSVEAVAWAAHPLYETAPLYFHDVGVVILQEPGFVLDPSEYGVLPTVDQLDSLKVRPQTTFTAVGYGLQKSFPTAAAFLTEASRTRYNAEPWLVQINVPGFTGDFSLLLSNNAHSGGTCFGDSGGANFLGSGNGETKIVAGITSFGLNTTCAGTGGVFRTDRQDVQDFVYGFAGASLP